MYRVFVLVTAVCSVLTCGVLKPSFAVPAEVQRAVRDSVPYAARALPTSGVDGGSVSEWTHGSIKLDVSLRCLLTPQDPDCIKHRKG